NRFGYTENSFCTVGDGLRAFKGAKRPATERRAGSTSRVVGRLANPSYLGAIFARSPMRVLVVIILAGLLGGCSRAFYRLQADKESYHAIRERDCDLRWQVPYIGIDPPPGSRIHDPYNPDHPAMPPDDPAAHRYMHCVYGMRGYRRWHKDGD